MDNSNRQADNHAKGVVFFTDVKTCLAFLSRLPVGQIKQDRKLADASAGFGVVGLIIGALTGFLFWLCASLGLPDQLAMIFTMTGYLLMTGGLHEDGLADYADSLGGWDQASKLKILHDSRIGSYGVLALGLALGAKIVGYGALLAPASSLWDALMIFASIGASSRSTMALMMYQLPLARRDGQAFRAGKPPYKTVRAGLMIGLGTGLGLIFLVHGVLGALAVLIGVFAAYFGFRALIMRQLGGYSGDILGALQQVSEISILTILLIFT